MNIDYVGYTVRSLVYFTPDPFFLPFPVNNSFSIKKMTKKYPTVTQIIFSNLHVSPNFHYDRTNNKEKNGSTDPLT